MTTWTQRLSIGIVALASSASLMAQPEIPITGVGGLPTLDEKIVERMRSAAIPGSAWAMTINGRLVMARGYGFANLEARDPLRPTHLFRIASVSKSITAVAALRLVDEGKLDLDERVFDVLLADLLPQGGPADPRLLDITARHLIHHTAGWDRAVEAPLNELRAIARDMAVPSPPSAETIVRWLAARPLHYTPGQGFAYSNVGYVVLGRVISRAAGVSYEEYVRSAVMRPIGNGRVQVGNTLLRDRVQGEVTYYSGDSLHPSIFDDVPGQFPLAYGGFGHFPSQDAGGGWIASAVDLARCGIAIDGDPSTREVLLPESQRYMRTDAGNGYGAGWWVDHDQAELDGTIVDLVTWSHNGNTPGTWAFMGTANIPEADLTLAIVALFNVTKDFDINDLLTEALVSYDQFPPGDLFGQF